MSATRNFTGGMTAATLLAVPVLAVSLLWTGVAPSDAMVLSGTDYQAEIEQLASATPTADPLSLANWNYTAFRLPTPSLGGNSSGGDVANDLFPQNQPCSAFDIGCKIGSFFTAAINFYRSFLNLIFFFL